MVRNASGMSPNMVMIRENETFTTKECHLKDQSIQGVSVIAISEALLRRICMGQLFIMMATTPSVEDHGSFTISKFKMMKMLRGHISFMVGTAKRQISTYVG